MTLTQFRKLTHPIYAYLAPKENGKNENKFDSMFWTEYNDSISIHRWYEIYSPVWNDKKKCYITQNGKVTIRIRKDREEIYQDFGTTCTLEKVQNFINEKLKQLI